MLVKGSGQRVKKSFARVSTNKVAGGYTAVTAAEYCPATAASELLARRGALCGLPADPFIATAHMGPPRDAAGAGREAASTTSPHFTCESRQMEKCTYSRVGTIDLNCLNRFMSSGSAAPDNLSGATIPRESSEKS